MNDAPQIDLARILATHAERPLLIDAPTGTVWTYADVQAIATGLSRTWRHAGLERGARIATLTQRRAPHALLAYACMLNGYAFVPLPPDTAPDDLGLLLARSRPARLYVDDELLPRLDEAIAARQDGGDPLPAIERATFADADHQAFVQERTNVSADDSLEFRAPTDRSIASIHFTSGTTSTPKGVVHCGPALLDAAHAFNEALGFTPDTRIYHTLPLSYMAGYLNLLLCPLVCGGSVVLERLWDARLAFSFWQHPRQYDVNAMWLVPSMLAALLKVDRDRTAGDWCREHLKQLCVGTAPLPHVVREAWEAKYGVDCHESYGLSETLFISSASARTTKEKGSVGRLLAGVRLTTDASATTPLGTDDDPIWASVPWMFLGYLGDDGQPDPETAPSVYPTGDRGLITAQGNLSIVGRDKDLIIRGGRNISPVALENRLSQMPEAGEVIVVGVPDDLLGEKIVAVFASGATTEQGSDTAPPPLTVRPKDDPAWSWIGANLPEYLQPNALMSTTAFPRTASGKVIRRTVRDQVLAVLGGTP